MHYRAGPSLCTPTGPVPYCHRSLPDCHGAQLYIHHEQAAVSFYTPTVPASAASMVITAEGQIQQCRCLLMK